MKSRWTRPRGYMKGHSQAIGTFTKHGDRENCWVGFVEGRAAIAYFRPARSEGVEIEQDCLIIFDDPYGDQFHFDGGQP